MASPVSSVRRRSTSTGVLGGAGRRRRGHRAGIRALRRPGSPAARRGRRRAARRGARRRGTGSASSARRRGRRRGSRRATRAATAGSRRSASKRARSSPSRSARAHRCGSSSRPWSANSASCIGQNASWRPAASAAQAAANARGCAAADREVAERDAHGQRGEAQLERRAERALVVAVDDDQRRARRPADVVGRADGRDRRGRQVAHRTEASPRGFGPAAPVVPSGDRAGDSCNVRGHGRRGRGAARLRLRAGRAR